MTADRPAIKPTLDIPLKDALEELTGWEVLAIEKAKRKPIEELGSIGMTIAVVWAYMNRDGQKTSWADVEKMTLRELNGFFAAPSVEPEDEQGKDDSGE